MFRGVYITQVCRSPLAPLRLSDSSRRLLSQGDFPRHTNNVPSEAAADVDWLWNTYQTSHAPFDKAFIEKWKNDLDGVLVFTGLFSAMVSGFFIDSWRSLKPDPETRMIHLLTNISAILTANASDNHSIIISSHPEHFTVSPRDLKANLFFMYSLFFSVTCALAATLLQRWVRMFEQDVTELPVPGSALGRRRALAFLGTQRFIMTAVAENMPLFLHISVFLFFIGFIEYLREIDELLADSMFGLVMYMSIAYAILTVCPLIWRDCPYQTPLSFVIWRAFLVLTFIITFIARGALRIRAKLSSRPIKSFFDEHPKYYKPMCLGEFTARARANGKLRKADAVALIDLASLLRNLDDKKRFLRGMIAFLTSCGVVPDKADTLPCEARAALKYLADHSAPIISVITAILSSHIVPSEAHEGDMDPSIQACMEAFRIITFRFSSRDKPHTPRIVFFRSIDDLTLDDKVVPILDHLSKGQDGLIAVTARSMLALMAVEAVYIASMSVAPEKVKFVEMLKRTLFRFCPVMEAADDDSILRDGPYACTTSLLRDTSPHIATDALLAYILLPALCTASASARFPWTSEEIESILDRMCSKDCHSSACDLTYFEELSQESTRQVYRTLLYSAAFPERSSHTPSITTRIFAWIPFFRDRNGSTSTWNTFSVTLPSRRASEASACWSSATSMA
ncbi:hypothetical protein OF83DRAFT_1148130 [Amylostereum chailletii]|nr:hypothetical protein OF83DRAFT_1148130 [Amylostereum chailletii]